MIILQIPLLEDRNEYALNYKLLTPKAKIMLNHMAKIYRTNKTAKFGIDDFRGPKLGSWRDISDILFELESRQFGVVHKIDNTVGFVLSVSNVRKIRQI